jgi:hypothetical protein
MGSTPCFVFKARNLLLEVIAGACRVNATSTRFNDSSEAHRSTIHRRRTGGSGDAAGAAVDSPGYGNRTVVDRAFASASVARRVAIECSCG